MVDPDSPIAKYTDETISAVHHALRASRRRLAVVLITYYVASEPSNVDGVVSSIESGGSDEDSIPVRQLARDIVCLEEGVKEEQATGPPYRNVYNALVQTHLPRLDEIRAIEFDADRKTVRPGRNLEALAVVAAISSPLAQKLFHATVASLYAGGTVIPEASISD